MNQLYGVANHSLVHVYDKIKPLAKKYETTVKVVDDQPSKARIQIFPSFKIFKQHAARLKKRKAIAIILDSPLQLVEIRGLEILDFAETTPGIESIFRIVELPKPKLRQIVKSASVEKLKKLKVHTQDFELIPKLLEIVKEGRFLDKFQTLLYTTKMDNRNKIRMVVTKYLFDKTKMSTVETILGATFKRGLGANYAKQMIEYLKSDNGQNLYKACQHINSKRSGKKKQVPYKAIAKKFGVEQSELKYLSKLARIGEKEGEHKPRPLSREQALGKSGTKS